MTIEHCLAVVIIPLSVYAWVSAVILAIAARRRPRIAVLTERALVALGLAVFGTVYSLVVINAEVVGLFDATATVVLVRLAVVGLLCLPAYWSWAYATGRLGR